MNLKWVAYAPTNYDPEKAAFPPIDSIQKDLKLLFEYGFNGVVTYGSMGTLAEIPKLAREAGFKGVIMGIWAIEDADEIENAQAACPYVDGYCMGNEGLNVRYDLIRLKLAIGQMKSITNKPVTTTEHITDYSNDQVFDLGDWIFPNIHPFLFNVDDPEKGAQWIAKHCRILTRHAKGCRVVLVKEAGFPTAGAPKASQRNQKVFFNALKKLDLHYVYFEAFDQPWKNSLAIEKHWGLFKSRRQPKSFIASEGKTLNK